jgi:hypothetical protein
MAFGDFTVVRSTVKNVLNSSGVLASVAVNTPAFEFNTDGSYKGLLVEPGAANLLTYSQQFDNGAWNKAGGSITANTDVAPDGTTTMDTFTEDGAGGEHIVYSGGITSVGPKTIMGSVFVEKGTRRYIQIVHQDASAGSVSAIYDLDTNTVTDSRAENIGPTNTFVLADVEEYPNDQVRLTLAMTTTGDTTVFIIAHSNVATFAAGTLSNGVITYTGDGTSTTKIWQAQLELGDVATSPIYTVGSTVARTADDISLVSASSLSGQGQGTIFMEVDWRSSAGPFQVLVNLSDGTANNEISIYRTTSEDELRMLIVSNGGLQTNQGGSSAAYDGISKFAFAYNTNDCILYKDGSSISTDTVVDLSALATLSEVRIGQSATDASQANMWIRSVVLFPTRLANATLDSLTTL